MSVMRAMDAAFLAMEKPTEPRHLGSVSIFGPSAGGPLTFDVLRDLLTERLPLIASARRVVVPVPFGLGRPSWATDRRFDLEFHLRHTAVPASGGEKALADFIARTHARPLDRSRPLWELWFVDGLSGGRVALYAKVHMAAIDGVTGAEVMTALLDADRTAAVHVQPVSPRDGEVERIDPFERWLGALPDQARQAVRFPRRLVGRAAEALNAQLAGVGDTLTETIHRTPGLEAIARLLPTPATDVDVVDERTSGRAPMLSWNGPITGRRRFAMTRLDLDQIIAVKREAGTTVNDVVVTVVAGAARHWLAAHDELPTSPTVALVPLLVGEGTADAHVAGLIVALPTHVADPAERLRRASESLRIAKERRRAVPASLMQDVSLFAPPAVAALAGRMVGALPNRSITGPTVNLAISNVPGSREQMYLAGRPLEANYPVLTINQLTPVHIGLQSSPGAIGVGALSCRDTLDDLAPLVERMDDELAILAAAVGASSTTRAGNGTTRTTRRRR
jgi:WS/DGAT/MGAT family acyltransferase